MDKEKLVKNLTLRGFTVSRFSSGSEAADYICGKVSATSVGIGGCKTAEQLGLYERLSENNEVYWHWKVPGPETYAKANSAPVYITSANAISEDGEILNIDGTGNRLAAQVYGKKKVYIIVGQNKICPDFDAALYRARNVAAVRNGARFKKDIPCQIDGKCHDCRAKDRICNALLVLWGPMNGMDTEVVLIDEDYGF